MGVRTWLVGRAIRATRVLVLECPDGWHVRVAAERAVLRRGWRLSDSPASADVLFVAGEARDELAQVVDRLWDAMPGPRAAAGATAADEVETALDEAVVSLANDAAQRRDAEVRGTPPLVDDPSDTGAAGPDDGDTEHDGLDHDGMEHGMDHGDMDMAPDGIPLAEGTEEDRDGLEMDALPVRLGPVLPAWPAGLVLDVTLHGDLVVAASAQFVGVGRGTPALLDASEAAARRCDDVAAALALAGWEDGAGDARVARDLVLARRDDDAAAVLGDLRRRVRRSRWLRWSLAGAGLVTARRAAALGAPDAVVGDCHDRLLALLDRAEAAARSRCSEGPGPVPPDLGLVDPQVLAELVVGLDVGVARLLVAGLGPQSLRTPEVLDA